MVALEERSRDHLNAYSSSQERECLNHISIDPVVIEIFQSGLKQQM